MDRTFLDQCCVAFAAGLTAEEAWAKVGEVERRFIREAVQATIEAAIPGLSALSLDDRSFLADQLRETAKEVGYTESEVGVFGSDALAAVATNLATLVEAMGEGADCPCPDGEHADECPNHPDQN
jgi:hypothetical protein